MFPTNPSGSALRRWKMVNWLYRCKKTQHVQGPVARCLEPWSTSHDIAMMAIRCGFTSGLCTTGYFNIPRMIMKDILVEMLVPTNLLAICDIDSSLNARIDSQSCWCFRRWFLAGFCPQDWRKHKRFIMVDSGEWLTYQCAFWLINPRSMESVSSMSSAVCSELFSFLSKA